MLQILAELAALMSGRKTSDTALFLPGLLMGPGG